MLIMAETIENRTSISQVSASTKYVPSKNPIFPFWKEVFLQGNDDRHVSISVCSSIGVMLLVMSHLWNPRWCQSEIQWDVIVIQWDIKSDLMGYSWNVPSGNDYQFAIEAMAKSKVLTSFPIRMVDPSSSWCQRLQEGNPIFHLLQYIPWCMEITEIIISW